LRNDTNGFAHQGMLNVLRDAFDADTPVNVEYQVDPGEFGKPTAQSFASRAGNKKEVRQAGAVILEC